MVGCINGCESVNIVILSVVHLSKFGCFCIGCWCGFLFFVFLCVVRLMHRAIAGCPNSSVVLWTGTEMKLRLKAGTG